LTRPVGVTFKQNAAARTTDANDSRGPRSKKTAATFVEEDDE
jgi:hypothetical protein